METQDIFEKSMGTFKRYHWCLTFLIFLIRFPVGWQLINIVIIGPPPHVTCSDNQNECAINCSKRTIDPSPFTRTIQSQWNLACNTKYLADFAQMFMMLGVMLGGLCFGILGDKFGRRIPISIALVIQAFTATFIAYVPWLWLFLVLRFAIGFSTGGTMTLSFVLIMELIGKRKRLITSTFYQIPSGLAHLSLAGIGYFYRDWRHAQLFMSVPSFFFLSYFWLIPESPRYLVSAGKIEKAIQTMTKIAQKNHMPTENIAADVNSYVATLNNAHEGKRGEFKDLFVNIKIFWRTAILCINWVTVGLVFYGVSQYSSQMHGDIFLNLLLSSVSLVPGIISVYLMMKYLGRKYTLIIVCFISGTPMLIIPMLNENSLWVPIMALFSLFGLEGYFAVLYIYTGELYPTHIRGLALGFLGMSCRTGTIAAAFIATLGQYHCDEWVVPVIFGVGPLISGTFAIFLPDPKNDILPDTLEEALNIGQDKSKQNT